MYCISYVMTSDLWKLNLFLGVPVGFVKYKGICGYVPIDGVVVATAQQHWDKVLWNCVIMEPNSHAADSRSFNWKV